MPSSGAALRFEQRAWLFERAATLWTPSKTENPDEWAARNRIYGPETGVPGPRNPKLTPYAIPFARSVGLGTYPVTVMVTAAQSGKTESYLDVIGERLDNRPVPLLYVGPSREFNTDQFEPRLRDLFLQARALLAKVTGGLDGKRQKKLLKRVAGVTLRLASARSTTALKSAPAALALVDEYDEMLRALRDQGDVLGLILARGETYADFTCGVTSTPSQGLVDIERDEASGLDFWAVTEEDNVTSPIWRLWQQGTRHHWCWPCPCCGDWFVPRFKQLRYPEGASPAEALRDSWLECPRCEARIHERHKAALNDRGTFVAPGETITRDGVKSGAPADVNTLSLWVSGLCSPFRTFGERAERYLTAFKTGNSGKIQTAINAAFGEVASPAVADLPTWEEIQRKAVGLRAGTIPPGAVVLVAAIDVQKTSLPFVIRAFGARGTSWLVRHGYLGGSTASADVWDQLALLLTTPIEGMVIKLAVVDSGFRPGEKVYLPLHRVYDFCRRYARFVYPSKGSSSPMHKPLIESAIEVDGADGTPKAYGLRLLRLDTDHWKALVQERLMLPADAPGCLHLNADADEDYGRQLVSEARVVGKDGKPVWVRLQKANHFLDCEAMAAAGAHRLEAEWIGAKAGERAAERRSIARGVIPIQPMPIQPMPIQPMPILALPAASVTPTATAPTATRRRRSMANWARRLNG